MAFGPGTGAPDLSRKGSLTARWPEGKALENLNVPQDYEALAKVQNDKLKAQATEDHQRGLRAAETGNVGELAGRMANGAAAMSIDTRGAANKEEKKREEAFRNFVLREQLRRIEADLAHYQERIRLLQGYQDALQRHLEKLKNGEDIEKNADGSLKDQQAEEAIRAYEEQYGVTVDRDNPDQISDVLRVHKEDERLNAAEYNHKHKEYSELREQADKIGMLSSEEAIKSDKDSLRNRGIIGAAELLTQAENEEVKAEIIASRGFKTKYEEGALDAAEGNFFLDTEIGSQNPFSKGEISGTFTKQATAESVDKAATQPLNTISYTLPNKNG